MRGYVLSRYGGKDAAQLRDDVAVPEPGADQVRVKVHAAGLNPVDFKTREGVVKLVVPLALPCVMGNELAGVVEKLGPGVTSAAGVNVGDNVYARVEKRFAGAFAEHAVVKLAHLAKAPTSIDLTTAAAVPLAALTALQVLRDELHAAPGKRILITGGAGGVGTFAVQIAKKLGAQVVTTASPRGADLCKQLGADEVVDYTTTTRLHDVVNDTDGVFDTVGGDSLEQAFPCAKRGTKVVSIAAMPEPKTARDLGRGPILAAMFFFASAPLRKRARSLGVSYRYLFMHESGADLALLAQWIDAGAVRPVVDRTFPLAQIAEAFAYLETGRAKGKVVVTIA